ncbi:MAG: lipopolysaccharide heptosyltransferase I [Thermodesulfovibrionia bacterium]
MQYKEIKDILILMPDKHMGNLVVSIPAIRSIRESFKDTRVHLLVDDAYIEIVETIGLDTLIQYPRRQLRRGSMGERLMAYIRLINHIRDTNPDITIDLEGREYSSLLAYLSGAPIRYGPVTSKRVFFYNRKVSIPDHKHKIFKYLAIASSLGAIARTGFDLKPSDERRASLWQKLKDYGVDLDRPIVCIHPSAGKVYKQWSLEGFAEISDWLTTKGLQVVFIGSNKDIDEIKRIEAMTKNHPHNMAGRLSLGELMALFGLSSLFIGNDSGPMHLAVAVGLPVIALFGPADERRWGPLSNRAIILRGDEPCERCKGRHCEYEFRCIRRLSPDDVKNAVRMLLRMGERVAE